MAGSHVDIVREGVSAMRAGDIERVASLCTPDVEFSPLRAGITGALISTAETEVHSAAVFSFRDDKISAMYDYGDAATARRALSG